VNPTDELDAEVAALIRSASWEDATELLTLRWQDYLPDRSARLRERIVALPEESWCDNPALLIGLGASHRAAAPANSFAALSFLDAADGLIPDTPEGGGHLATLSALTRSAALRGLGQVEHAREQVRVAETHLSSAILPLPLRISLQARTQLELGICLALSNDFEGADSHLRHGLALAGPGAISASVVEALGWLAIIECFSYGPNVPLSHIDQARQVAEAGGIVAASVTAPASLAECMIAIDEGSIELATDILRRLDGTTTGTEYDLFRLHLLAVVLGATAGPLEQLETLQSVQLALNKWQFPTLLHQLHDAERANALIQLGSMTSARAAITALAAVGSLTADLHHAHCPARFAARLAMHSGDYELVLSSTTACRMLGDNHAPRSLAYVDALRSAAHDALGDAGTAAVTIDRALLLASRSRWRRQFTSLPQERLQSMIDSARTREHPAAVTALIDELADTATADLADSIAPLSARERLILSQIVAGKSRQEMSTHLRVSPNTIKSQVRSIYRKLGAANRHEAIDRAGKYGIRV
jgi:LuxR family maltose regulon positive regulatory protein